MKSGLFYILSIFITVAAGAQPLDQLVDLDYRDVPLRLVLAEIDRKYDCSFAYSSDFIPLDMPVYISVRRVSLRQALDQLFEDTAIAYAAIGHHITLKFDRQKQLELIGRLENKKGRETSVPDKGLLAQRRFWMGGVPKLRRVDLKEIPGGERVEELHLSKFVAWPRDVIPADRSRLRVAQVSILPFMGTNSIWSNQTVNHLSLNVFWGTSGGLDGLELGGFMNTIVGEVRGMQIAGIGNMIGGRLTGSQVAGFFNIGNGGMVGLQAAGAFNFTGGGKGLQAAGLFNISLEWLTGTQVAGAFNLAASGIDGTQVGGLFNWSGDRTDTQIASLINLGKRVDRSQISLGVNIAEEVGGFQIGLINVAGSVDKLPLGLVSYVKNGYRALEMSAGDALFTNVGYRLGVRRFYNIFHIGARWDSFQGGMNNRGTSASWGLGYGLGTALQMGESWSVNAELLSLHVNERELWTPQLNQLNQLRLLAEKREGAKMSFFAGPVANLMLSRLRDAEGSLWASRIAPYTLYEKHSDDLVLQFWIGLNAGIRL